jgi:hypothetical protein
LTKTIREALTNPETEAQTKQHIHYDLIMKAFDIVTTNLRNFGNNLGEEHETALMELIGGFGLLAFGVRRGRYAYPLPTGMGKTQSIVAFCAALHQLEYKDVSVAVSAGKVEALAQLKRDLISNGVPPESIGLVHSYKYDHALAANPPEGYATEPSTDDNDNRPIMLVTHSRIKRGKLGQFNQYQGRPRNLLIWDESLLVSNSRFISHRKIKKAFGHRQPDMSEGCEAIKYFQKAIEHINDELERQKAGGDPIAITLPTLSDLEMTTMLKEVGSGAVEEPLRAFLEMCQEPLRAAHTNQEGGMISYDITIPRELESIAILDASYPIRELEKMDKSIQLGGNYSSNMKRYDHVKLHHLQAPSGRQSMTADFSKGKREERKVSSEVCDLVERLPQDEGVIIFTFKKADHDYNGRKAVDFKKLLIDDLSNHGVDTKATVMDEKKIVDRFVFLTWGQETSLSQYSYCKHVVFAGVLHRSHLSLASEIVGQVDNLMEKVTSSHIEEVMVSEIAHYLYQAMSRGSCRKIEGNQAHRMDAWLIHGNDSVKSLMVQVMPGMQWLPWKGSHLLSAPKQRALMTKIDDYLANLPTSVNKVSTVELKKATGLQDTPISTFTRALRETLGTSERWYMEGRSVVRMNEEETFSDFFDEI